MKLSIIIPHHNGKKLLHDCLQSIYHNISIDSFEIIVVDNLSTDDSAEEAKRNFPSIVSVSYTHLTLPTILLV